jgi:Zn-dependent peptidase ImmA (M78 family)
MGVLVVVEDFPREEARGFSLWHPDLIPMVVVSANEAPAAQIFTLFHEFVHILLRSDAICLKQEAPTFLGRTEAWCNKVAAAILIPDNDLRALLEHEGTVTTTKEWPIGDLHRIASRFKVSRHVAAIRLEEMGFAPRGYYAGIKRLLESDDYKTVRPRPVSELGDKPRRNVPKERLSEVGFVATNAILESCRTSALSTMEAYAQSQRYG